MRRLIHLVVSLLDTPPPLILILMPTVPPLLTPISRYKTTCRWVQPILPVRRRVS